MKALSYCQIKNDLLPATYNPQTNTLVNKHKHTQLERRKSLCWGKFLHLMKETGNEKEGINFWHPAIYQQIKRK